ncbi:thrombospondin type 3 repeat-containing protein [Candidatus Gracilibacteria bacterium]|nr:thrombospondin type 3 repeat-containing protein [Candidatus Gracilibacteria bacterium]
MKIYICTVLLVSSLSVCFASDLSSYKNVRLVQELNVSQPAIVEITKLDQLGNYVVTNDKGDIIPQQPQTIRKTKLIPPSQVEGCTNVCVNAPALADGNEKTTFDFPLLSSGKQSGKIKIVYAKPIETSSVIFKTTSDSYTPTVFTLMIDGKRILNTIQGGSARFPKMLAQNVEIEFEYSQPIRFTEVGIGSLIEEEIINTLRFVYQPKTTYMLYTNSLVRSTYPSPAINLYSKNKEAEVTLGEVYNNPQYVEDVYVEKDFDNDGILDIHDNCPSQFNSDQKDSNGNGVGDICDDYDYDGVLTYNDNCPEIENPHQEDKDRDGMGDVCDSEESRITEKYGWIPWVVFLGVFLAVGAMGYEVIRMKKSKEEKKG